MEQLEADSYEPRSYWRRLHEQPSLAGVSQPHLSVAFNRWLYRCVEHQLDSILRRYAVRIGDAFDVGAGTGHWVEYWLRHGASSVGGCDLIELAVDRLRSRFGPDFAVVELGRDPLVGQYSTVSVFNVLLHITDEDLFIAALRSIARAVAPSGHLVLVEPLQISAFKKKYQKGGHSLARPADAYLRPLAEEGLEMVEIRAATAIGSDPVEARSKAGLAVWDWAWRMVNRAGKRLPAAVAGRATFMVDRFLVFVGASPSSKLILLRRPPG